VPQRSSERRSGQEPGDSKILVPGSVSADEGWPCLPSDGRSGQSLSASHCHGLEVLNVQKILDSAKLSNNPSKIVPNVVSIVLTRIEPRSVVSESMLVPTID